MMKAVLTTLVGVIVVVVITAALAGSTFAAEVKDLPGDKTTFDIVKDGTLVGGEAARRNSP